MPRGEVFRFKVPKGVGHEQQGERFGVIVQSDSMLPRSVILVAPTSRSARPASFRPEVVVAGTRLGCSSNRSVQWMPSGSGVGWGSWRRTKCGPSMRRSSPCSASTDPRRSAARRCLL